MSSMSYKVARDTFARRLEEWDWADQSASRRNILEAFLELAIANGFNSVSMRTIANAVNIKPPSLYSHFPGGRDEIVADSLRWHFHRFGSALLAAVDQAPSAGEFWDEMVRVHFTRQVTLPESNLWDLLVATDRMAHILPTTLRAQVDDWVTLHQNMYVAAAIDMGFAKPEERVKVVMTLLEGATRWASTDVNEEGLAALTEQAITLSRTILALDF
ncbi:TetR/AcrR family transcriptional regulator [Paenarthrobacter nitroguajacolicus]|uniref:TetR/AcrR family transcriptional regulator n=1 Tax=Paenarthrobacter nitroguajacolicus TaxID=211146 RepID=UPI003AEC617D